MRASGKVSRRPREQDGYALVLVVFLTTLMLISVMAIAPSLRTEKQREKEEEMIWRGKQYARGIKLFYRKNGRFPTSMDDLTKPKLGSLRFMRKAYKDPMNQADGSWRMIYVGPAGQLIGSLKPPQTLQIPGASGLAPAGSQPTSGLSQSGFGSSGFGQAGFGQSGSQAGTQAATQTANPQARSNATPGQANNSGTTDDGSALPAAAISSDNPIVGGNIIGVGSKINKRSVIVYDKAKNYRLFEFVWNPSKDLANALQTGTQIGTPIIPGQPGNQGQGTAPGQQPPANQPGMPEPAPPRPPQP